MYVKCTRYVEGETMKKNTKRAQYGSGHFKHETVTGRNVEVQTSKGVTKASAISRTVVKEVSAKRGAALQRLANR